MVVRGIVRLPYEQNYHNLLIFPSCRQDILFRPQIYRGLAGQTRQQQIPILQASKLKLQKGLCAYQLSEKVLLFLLVFMIYSAI